MKEIEAKKHFPDPRCENLLRLLDAEITLASQERQQAGWTQGAILGGMAGIIWLLLDQIQESLPQMKFIYLFSLYSIVLLTALHFLYKSAIRYQSAIDTTVRFISTNDLGPSRARFAFEFLGFSSFIYLTFTIPLTINLAAAISLKIFIWLVAFGSLGGLIMSFCSIPLPSKPRFAFSIHWLTITPLAVWASLEGIFSIASDIGAVLPEVKVSCLIVALYFLTMLLLGDAAGSPLIRSLIEIRRGVVLGVLSADAAREQTDIALAGQRVTHTIQNEITRILALYSKAASEATEGLRIIEAFLNTLPQTTTNLSNEQSNIAKAVLDSCTGYVKGATNSLQSAGAQSKSLGSKLLLLKRMEPNAAQEIQELRDKLIETIQSNPPPLKPLIQLIERLRMLVASPEK